jgi:hypothetical protein
MAAKGPLEAGPAEVPFSQIDDPAVRAALSGLVRAVVERPAAGR